MNKENILEIYIHIPFCEQKCHYCDFVSFPMTTDMINKYISVLIDELRSKSVFAKSKNITSIYIGGGTPSYIDSHHIEDILRTVYYNFNVSKNCEISIELNPHSALWEKMSLYKRIGINRLSFGVQSANNDELKTLGRLHSFEDFIKSYDDAVHLDFKNINADVISGIPNQTALSYKNSLKKIMQLHLQHISIYNLIIEPNTLFYKLYQNNELILPDENTMTAIDNITDELTDYYNYKQYEISNYAKDNFICLHNYGYWSDIDYLGVGLNASSYLSNVRYKNLLNFNDYINLDYKKFEENENKNLYFDEINILSKKELISEYVFLGMRKTTGINSIEFFQKFKENIEDIYTGVLDRYLELGLIKHIDNNYFLSKRGMQISNRIFSDFIL